VPVQRCWAPKIRTVLNQVRKPHQVAVKAGLHRIMNAASLPAAWSAARRFADPWESIYPKAVAGRRAAHDDLLTCFRYPTLEARKAVPTTNAIERRLRKVRRRTRPTGTFQDRTSMDRILFAVFLHENRNHGHLLRPDTNLLTLPDARLAARARSHDGRSTRRFSRRRPL
jgi:transposase-like protein